ncbi:Panacea domain-containing protein [Pseudarcicella hirudinis]|uniref:Panacea domain-containing protein n=1 Tax=Pseudarcicella hirudinis TaxID=1079859 RepID=UPI0035EFE6E7
MYSALAIASKFIDLGIQSGKPVSPMKLQKIVYFAQGVHLARYQKPLIDEAVEAWTYGPVIPSLYHTFKHLGNSPIVESAQVGIRFEGHFYPKFESLEDSARETIQLTWEITKDFGFSAI